MSGWYFHHLLLIAIAGVTLFAWLKGGWPERIGAAVNLAGTVVFYLGQQISSLNAFAPGLLILDGVLGVSFLVLALRYTSLWLGAAMLLQAGQFSLHAFYYVTAKPFDLLFAVVNNVVSWGILIAIVTGTFASWVQTRRAAKAAAL
ncbi:MAG: hypothetical protein JWM33_1625 [Caulobacteraceae bacterium]|jgi:hypothetical protein|nr:hypothetical protein [Caulobacteraceae bacterium]